MSRSKARKIKVRIIKPKKHKVVFIGTSEFAVPVLKALLDSSFLNLNTVVTQPDRKAGREQKKKYSPVKQMALKHKEIKLILQPEKVSQITKKIKELEPDLIIVVAFGQIIPKEILKIPKKGCLNIHPSLLPKYRGPSPIQTAILVGEKTTGTSIILMDEKFDHGPIIAQLRVRIRPDETAKSLEKKLAQKGTALLKKILPDWLAEIIKPKPQNDKRASLTKMILREDGKIYWDNTAQEIANMIRAFDPWPGTYALWRTTGRSQAPKKLKILKARVISQNKKAKRPFGKIFLTIERELVVQTGKGLLILEEVQLESKAPMRANNFLNGYPQILGDILI